MRALLSHPFVACPHTFDATKGALRATIVGWVGGWMPLCLKIVGLGWDGGGLSINVACILFRSSNCLI